MAYRHQKGGHKGQGGRGAGRGQQGGYGRGDGGYGRGGRGGGGDPYGEQTTPSERVFAVKPDEHISKSPLRHICGEAGPFFLAGAENEESFFAAAAVAKTRTTENCEGLQRFGHFWSFLCANVEVGSDALLGLISEEDVEDRAALKYLINIFSTELGVKALAAVQYLNVKNNVARSK